jgi:hypothetical protein
VPGISSAQSKIKLARRGIRPLKTPVRAGPEGRLPFELPSSMEAVRQQKEDLPHDSKDPLYPFGFGLRYK